MQLLAGKRILVTGITNADSIAFRVAQIAQLEGAEVVVTALPRAAAAASRALAALPTTPELIELDVTDAAQLAALPAQVGPLDGLVHSIAFASPKRALGGKFLDTEWDDVALALHTSAYSLVSLTRALLQVFRESASVVGLTFDASASWPGYDWMGVAKAALEGANRYLARYLGPMGLRCNLVASGPIDTIAKTAIPGSADYNDVWNQRAPLGWDASDATDPAKAVIVLLSDWLTATTGEILFVDGGVHSTGA
ncbi:MAG: enoyl-ACP reductase FabI [Propionibacteriaceae bacterium]|jgi:enoyl-[acyl-carrier protein] reductase I|nr:enoyl-ACP reductase FabI [Propionibacteriaceae bacterium]